MDIRAKASAVYCCPSCNYQTLISPTSEFVRFYTVEFCPDCNTLDRKKFYPELVLITENNGETNSAWAHLREETSYCSHCTPGINIHWTELRVSCPVCKSADMIFKEYFRANQKKPVHNFRPGIKYSRKEVKK